MDRQRLTQLLKGPELVEKEDLGDLRTMVDQNPWFSGAHLLLAQGESTTGDVLVGRTLQDAAAHVPDREVLFHRMHPSAPAEAPSRAATMSVVPDLQDPPVEIPPSPPTPTAGPASETVAPPLPELGPTPPVVQAPELSPSPALPGEEIPIPAPTEPDRDLLERQMLEAVMASGFALSAPPADSPTRPSDPPSAPPQAAPEAADTSLPPIAAPVPPPAPTPAPERLPVTARLRFTEWLSAPSDPMPSTREDAQEPPAPLSVEAERPVIPAPPHEGTAMDTAALIDRFIREQTPEPRAKQAFFTPQEAAKRSLEDSDELVTETLARIYAAQGNTEKAIRAYRSLALKYPDKSSYFAALVKELEG